MADDRIYYCELRPDAKRWFNINIDGQMVKHIVMYKNLEDLRFFRDGLILENGTMPNMKTLTGAIVALRKMFFNIKKHEENEE